MTTIASSRSGVFADPEARFLPNLLGALRRAWSDALLYRRTLSELRQLNKRELEDLGLAGRDLAAIAHRAVYA